METTETVGEVLEHFGVKGMKWGVRKAETPRQKDFRRAHKQRGKVKRGLTKANVALNAGSKAIDKGEEKLIFLPQSYRNKAAASTQSRVLGEARKVNQDPKFKGKDIKNKPALKAEYHSRVEASAKKIYQEELSKVRTEATIDFIEAAVSPRGDRMNMTAPSGRIRHADGDGREILLALKLERDDNGLITDMSIVKDDELEQADTLEDTLAHYGVKGMRWGVRRSASERAAASEVVVTNKGARRGSQDIKVRAKAGKGVVATKGGKRNVATSEAIAAAAARQKAKASTTDALSNKEMKSTIERMNLEQQFKKLTKEQAKQDRGKRLVDAVLKTLGEGAAASGGSKTTTTATVVPRKAIGG